MIIPYFSAEIDKKDFKKILLLLDKRLEQYKNFEIGLKFIVPKRINEKVKDLIKKVDKVKSFVAYKEEADELLKVLELLRLADTINSPQKSGAAYGRLFVSLSKMIGRLPFPANAYAKPLERIGVNFEKIVGVFSPLHGNVEYQHDMEDFIGWPKGKGVAY